MVFILVFIGYKPTTMGIHNYDGDLLGGDWNHGFL